MSAAELLPLGHQIYPAKYFTASPTYNTWVKITAADILALRHETGFEGQNIYFHLNHPIQFVYLVAPIVAIEDLGPWTTIITLDDSSGACMDVKIARKNPATVEIGESNTTVKNVQIESGLGHFDVLIDGRHVDIMTVIKVKCTISSFRGNRQLELKRVNIIKDTNEEVAAWKALTAFKRDVLSKPWSLTARDIAQMEQRSLDEAQAVWRQQREAEAAARAKQERRVKRQLKRTQHEEKIEQRRKAEEKRMDAGALGGTDVLWHPYGW